MPWFSWNFTVFHGMIFMSIQWFSLYDCHAKLIIFINENLENHRWFSKTCKIMSVSSSLMACFFILHQKNKMILMKFYFFSWHDFHVNLIISIAWLSCKINHFHKWKFGKSSMIFKNMRNNVRFIISHGMFFYFTWFFLWQEFMKMM
jgi:hypothetical protein